MMISHDLLIDVLFRGRAYLDPGSGSILIQVLVAGLLGGAFLIKTYWRKLTSLFTRKNNTEKSLNNDSADDGR
jgi:hypothetical protein